MAVPSSKDAKLFYRVALERLTDADFLLTSHRTTAAVYLAGYGVECILKAYLLHSTPKGEQRHVLLAFRGDKGHSIESLLARCRKNGLVIDIDFREKFVQ